MPQTPQYPILQHSPLFCPPCVKRNCHLCTRYRYPEAMSPPVCVRDGAVVPLEFQGKSKMENSRCLVGEEEL